MLMSLEEHCNDLLVDQGERNDEVVHEAETQPHGNLHDDLWLPNPWQTYLWPNKGSAIFDEADNVARYSAVMPPMSSAEVSVHGSHDAYYRDEAEGSLASIV